MDDTCGESKEEEAFNMTLLGDEDVVGDDDKLVSGQNVPPPILKTSPTPADRFFDGETSTSGTDNDGVHGRGGGCDGVQYVLLTPLPATDSESAVRNICS